MLVIYSEHSAFANLILPSILYSGPMQMCSMQSHGRVSAGAPGCAYTTNTVRGNCLVSFTRSGSSAWLSWKRERGKNSRRNKVAPTVMSSQRDAPRHQLHAAALASQTH